MTFRLIDRLNFTAGVTGIPFCHNIEERSKLTRFSILTVDVIADGNKADAMLTEKHFGIKTDLQIIPPNSAHVFYNNNVDISGFNFRNHFLKAFAVKGGAAYTVITEMTATCETASCCEIFKDFLLVGDGIALALHLIVTTKARIQCRDFV